jgi:hypothetical protein
MFVLSKQAPDPGMYIQPIRLLLLMCCLVPCAASADWATFSVDYLCDESTGAFSLAPVIETSSPDTGETSPPPIGYAALPEGADQEFVCTLGAHKISMTYTAFGPQESGRCRGIGVVFIRSLMFDSERLLSGQSFNSGCFDERTPIRLDVNINAEGIYIRQCDATGWDWGKGYLEEKCVNRAIFARAPAGADEAKREENRRWRARVLKSEEPHLDEHFVCAGIRYSPPPPHSQDIPSSFIDDSTGKIITYCGYWVAFSLQDNKKYEERCPPARWQAENCDAKYLEWRERRATR